MELRASNFGDYFRAVHGYGPFPWQQALVDRLAESDEWPDILNLPTGSGKTAALDAAVFHLALRADRPQAAAIRIALVVDRRLVVDDAFARASRIAGALERARDAAPPGAGPQYEAVREIARRLQRLAGAGAPPLAAKRLRGGAPLEHDWARSPTQPTVLCSTVDQVGSRLLFRGYGVSDRMKPVHAGLLGTDTVILLDEAHLAEPFRQTIEAVRRFGRASVKLAVLSATSAVGKGSRHALCEEDRSHPLLKRRLTARKPAILKPVSKNVSASTVFAAEVRNIAARLGERCSGGFAVGVVVNRVALAREIYDLLAKDGDERTEALLMTGRSRSIDRRRTEDALKPFRTGNPSRENARPLIVVATQCLEVGVDLDLDGLVTQAAPLDALRQRFGRLNRDGRDSVAEGAILALASDIAKRSPDPVYGDRIRLAWEALTRMAADGKIDFGIDALEADLEKHAVDVSALAAPRDGAPTVMPAYLDLWSHTSPRPAADPEVGFFLHGAKVASDDVFIVWRDDIEPVMREEKRLAAVIGLVPPRPAEVLAIPLRAARNWLRDLRTAGATDASDVNEENPQDDEPSHTSGWRRAYRWAGPQDAHTRLVGSEDIRPGDILVVPASYGGCDEFGWNPADETPVSDVANDAATPFRGRRACARVARSVAGEDGALWRRLSAILGDDGADETGRIERLVDILRCPADTPLRADIVEPLNALRRAKGRISMHFPYTGDPDGGAIFVAEQGLRGAGQETRDSAAPSTEDDSLSHTSTQPVPLTKHGRHVEKFARRFAQTLELPPTVAADVRLAAFLHDAGKADRRFQTMLSGGSPWSLPESPLAKSWRPSDPGAWGRAGLPPDWRHEALSVRMARLHPGFAEAHDPALVLWLIGVHHGFGRPFYRFSDAEAGDIMPCLDVDEWPIEPGDAGPQSPGFEFDGMDWPELFRCLKLRYGIWGLAHLEAVLRLADHRASESESES